MFIHLLTYLLTFIYHPFSQRSVRWQTSAKTVKKQNLKNILKMVPIQMRTGKGLNLLRAFSRDQKGNRDSACLIFKGRGFRKADANTQIKMEAAAEQHQEGCNYSTPGVEWSTGVEYRGGVIAAHSSTMPLG